MGCLLINRRQEGKHLIFNWKWGCLLFVFFLAILFYPMPTLEVRNEKDGRVIFSRKVTPGEGFEFSYIHSVDKTPVTGYFFITSGKKIKPVETRFESYGPGLPSTERDATVEGRKIKVKTNALEMEHFSFFVSPMTGQAMIFKGERLEFSSFKEGEVMAIRVKSYPLFREVIFRHGSR
ncbi:MAG: DUF1850 domain-containing protein [Thermodesulfobacteriota bacterium]|nr:DUF1850 domain-containing protein [Thermodesulfobacteriota bacterium]